VNISRPREISEFERSYLRRMNRIALVFFYRGTSLRFEFPLEQLAEREFLSGYDGQSVERSAMQ
jgi:hypothetical protein